MTRRILPLVFVLSALPACGGTDEGRPNGKPVGADQPLDPCEADDGYELQNVVNFEPVEVGGRLVYTAACDATTPCTFYFNYDEQQSPENPTAPRPEGGLCVEPVQGGAVVFTQPDIAAMQPVPEGIQGGRCNQDQAGLRVIATNVGMCYGANGRLGWGAAFDINFSPVLDASEWDGLSFWVRNTAPVRRAVNLSISDPITSGDGIDPETEKPYCNATAEPVPDSEKCDAFGVAVTITEEWTFVPVLFSRMRQKGFGVPSILGELDTQNISRVQVLMSAGSWDFWVDDFALFRAPP